MKWIRNLTLGSLLVALCPAGVLAGGEMLALQTAEASCRDASTAIYVDCGNGTVTDNRTGLVWLANADCLGGGVDCGARRTVIGPSGSHSPQFRRSFDFPYTTFHSSNAQRERVVGENREPQLLDRTAKRTRKQGAVP